MPPLMESDSDSDIPMTGNDTADALPNLTQRRNRQQKQQQQQEPDSPVKQQQQQQQQQPTKRKFSFDSIIPTPPTGGIPKNILLLCLLFRLYNAYSLKTFSEPDEHWQSLEVAHEYVFGYGWLTWEWTYKLRGFAYPGLFALLFQALALFGLDKIDGVWTFAPQVLQACFAALGDYYTFRLSNRFFGVDVAKWTMAVTLLSWFQFMYSTRTLSNSIEAVFTVIGLYYWPWPGLTRLHPKKDWEFPVALLMAVIACLLRPTNAVIWIFVGVHLLFKLNWNMRWFVVSNVIMFMGFALTTGVVIDLQFYKAIEFPPYNFVKFNVLKDISTFYGTHPWHWYFSQGLAMILLTYLPVFLYGCYRVVVKPGKITDGSDVIPIRIAQNGRPMIYLIIWTMAVYSFLAHKEARFLLPITPLLMILTSIGLYYTALQSNTKFQWIMIFLMLTQGLLGFYVTNIHQRGVIDVMDYLRQQVDLGNTAEIPVADIGFLMPCHSTPYYSRLHRNVTMRFLTCEPPVDVIDRSTYQDEASHFYTNPTTFLQTHFKTLQTRKHIRKAASADSAAKSIHEQDAERGIESRKWEWPSHLVVFDSLAQTELKPAVDGVYKECARFFNTHFHPDPHRRGDVVVLCRRK